MSEFIRPAPDSQFRLLGCGNCGSQDVVYIQATTGGKAQYLARCRPCGQRTPWFGCRHDAQMDWNGRFGRQELEELKGNGYENRSD